MRQAPLCARGAARAGILALAAAALSPLAGCGLIRNGSAAPVTVSYIGSSTVAHFIRDAERVYREVQFDIDTEPESVGGEDAIAAGRGDLAGVAGKPRPETIAAGVMAAQIGSDAIAVLVHASNPVTGLSLDELRAVFSGQVSNWKDLGGPDLAVKPLIVSTASATRRVFRAAVLGEADYAGCEVVQPDDDMPSRVAADPGAVGQISFSFLDNGAAGRVRAVAVAGEEPSVTNFRYPISRPLFLLWRRGSPSVEDFVEWAQGVDGQRVVMRRFVGARVVASVRPEHDEAPGEVRTGRLVVYTETYPVQDGGIYYYPHRPYRILSRQGEIIRSVRNHRGENDESPSRVELLAGTYLIRPETSRSGRPEFLVTIRPGETTVADVEKLLRAKE
jgi:phosphate transport system substrate-binding protein